MALEETTYRHRSRDIGALIVAMTLPSVATWIYFVLLSGREGVMFWAYAACKVIQFGLPIFWVVWVQRRSPDIFRFEGGRGLRAGLLLGLAIFAAHQALYFAVLRGSPAFSEAPAALEEKLVGLGLTSPALFVLMGLFISVIHSFLEEYYWRWFVFRELRAWTGAPVAIVVSSLAFMAHHVIVIDAYFPPEYFWSVTVFFSFCVAVGGALWAWIYERTGSLWGAWLSHAIVDAAIMVTGYDLAFGIG